MEQGLCVCLLEGISFHCPWYCSHLCVCVCVCVCVASSMSPLHALAAQHSRLQPWNWLEHTVTSRLHLLEMASKAPASHPAHSYSVPLWSLHRAVRELPCVFAHICPPLHSRLLELVMHALIRYWQTWVDSQFGWEFVGCSCHTKDHSLADLGQ